LEVRCDDVLIFKIGDKTNRSRVSKIDGNVVKLFDEGKGYRQIPYSNLKRLFDEGLVIIERPKNHFDRY
jgi:hypothetical protein